MHRTAFHGLFPGFVHKSDTRGRGSRCRLTHLPPTVLSLAGLLFRHVSVTDLITQAQLPNQRTT